MSGPSVVDKAKMVFHYVAKIAKDAEAKEAREMKVCFRHSKHSIKCDINAPCVECDAGLKLYSYDQCRRHLDVVRAERRFESIEVDRSENVIEKLHELDDNEKRTVQLLEAILAKLEPREEERQWRDSAVCALKEVSKNTLRTLKKTEELADNVGEVVQQISKNEPGTLIEEVRRQTSLIEKSNALSERAAASSERTLSELTALREALVPIEGTLRAQSELLAQRVTEELEGMRREAENRFSKALKEVLTEIQSLKETSRDLRDSLPERLVDAFGGLLMLSQDKEEERGRGIEI